MKIVIALMWEGVIRSNEISHMPWRQNCLVKCKITLWSDLNLVSDRTGMRSNSNTCFNRFFFRFYWKDRRLVLIGRPREIWTRDLCSFSHIYTAASPGWHCLWMECSTQVSEQGSMITLSVWSPTLCEGSPPITDGATPQRITNAGSVCFLCC